MVTVVVSPRRTKVVSVRCASGAPDAPNAVAISEAVELARQISTDDSPRFLNGVLGRIAEYATR